MRNDHALCSPNPSESRRVSGMRFLRSLPLMILGCMALAACSSIREDLGLGRSPPDEFAVIDRPPLSMPPDFGLRPPRARRAAPAGSRCHAAR